MSTIQEKQLAQARPAGTSAVSLYSPASGVTWVAKSLYVCNTSGAGAAFSVYHDEDGTTYDQTSALFYGVTLAATETVTITALFAGNTAAGNLAVQSSVANALTFTLYGAEIS